MDFRNQKTRSKTSNRNTALTCYMIEPVAKLSQTLTDTVMETQRQNQLVLV